MHRSAPHCNFAEGILWHTSPPASERETFSVDFRRFSCSAKVKKTGHQILSPGFIKGTPPVRPGTPWSSCSLHKTRKEQPGHFATSLPLSNASFCHWTSTRRSKYLETSPQGNIGDWRDPKRKRRSTSTSFTHIEWMGGANPQLQQRHGWASIWKNHPSPITLCRCIVPVYVQKMCPHRHLLYNSVYVWL